MSSGCGCKEVYRFPRSFLLHHPYFLFIFKCFSFLFQYIFVIYLIIFSLSINKHTGDYGHPTEAV